VFKRFTRRIETKRQDRTSSSASARSVLQRAVADAEQIVASIKEKAKAEAEEEAVRIIARAAEEVEEMKREIEAVAGRELGETTVVATGEAGSPDVEVKSEAIPEVGEEVIKVEESAQLQGEVAEEKVEDAQPQEEATAPEPVAVTEEESLEKDVLAEGPSGEEAAQPQEETAASEPVALAAELSLEASVAEERPGEEEPEPALLEKDIKSSYTGEVELAVGKPVNPKVVSKLYNYLQVTPEIKFVHTRGSWNRGTSITITLDKPIPLISVLSSKIPEAKITPERPGEDGFIGGKKGVRRIKIALRKV